MKLDSDLHVIVWDLMECYDSTSKDRVRISLRKVIKDKLDDFFDPDEQYARSSLSIFKGELVFRLIVSLDDNDDTEYDAEDIQYTINLKTGKYQRQHQKHW